MDGRWNNGRAGNTEAYTPQQVKAVLEQIGVDIVGETYSDFLCFCPFHGNNHTPSFSVGVSNGCYICFNDSCGEFGGLTDLVRRMSGRNEFEAVRFIAKKGGETQQSFEDKLKAALEKPADFTEWDKDTFARLRAGMVGGNVGRDYLHSRGFNDETIEYFEAGYSQNQNMVTIPVHSPQGLLVGIVGRSISGKDFKNSKKLPRNRTLFNLHRAKRLGGTAIVTESAFDAMRVHQAGFPYVIGTLGGTLSPENYALLDRYFSTIIIMTDMDDKSKYVYKRCAKCKRRGLSECEGHNPGRELGLSITGLRTKNVLWAVHDAAGKAIYPHGAKDAGDMTDNEIRHCIENRISTFEYISLGLDKL